METNDNKLPEENFDDIFKAEKKGVLPTATPVTVVPETIKPVRYVTDPNAAKNERNKKRKSFGKFLLVALSSLTALAVVGIIVLMVIPTPQDTTPLPVVEEKKNWWTDIEKKIIPPLPRGAYIAYPTRPYAGIYIPGGFSSVQSFEASTGVDNNMVMFFKNWSQHANFDPTEARKVHESGAVTVISWEPWDPKGDSIDQPNYSMSTIVNGNHDAYIHTWAQQMKASRLPIAIRFAHEMNGNWYPWATSWNGNSPELYVQAYQHVVNIFREEGATNVAWIWSPNVNRYLADRPLASMYPGDDYVDIVGIVGYGGKAGDSVATVFDSTWGEIRTFTSKPILLTETGAAEYIGDKAAWITDLTNTLAGRPDVIGFIWFNESKRADWRVETSEASVAAYRDGIAYYNQTWVAPPVPANLIVR